MAMRELVIGGPACAIPGASSSSNPIATLVNSVVDSAKLNKGGLKELPVVPPTVNYDGPTKVEDPVSNLPGSEYDHQQYLHQNAHHSEFYQSFHAADSGAFGDVWNEIRQQPVPPPRFHGIQGSPQTVLSHFLHSFVDSSRAGTPFQTVALPPLGLSHSDKMCIRDRSCIMARHFFADKNEDFINAQVSALLHSLDIDNDLHSKGPGFGHYPELEEHWNESMGTVKAAVSHPTDQWVAEYNMHGPYWSSNPRANLFEQQLANGWASEFQQEQSQMPLMASPSGANISKVAEQSRLLAHTLAQNNDPKFQNSKFLQFMSKMSRGEIIVDDNQLKQAPVPTLWANEFEQQHGGPSTLADESDKVLNHRGETWVNEFASEHVHPVPLEEKWLDEFSKLHLDDWGDEFAQHFNAGNLGDNMADAWVDAYDKFLNEKQMVKQGSENSRSVYVFSERNPYVGHPNPLKEGQELFRRGLLSEAVLALEAEVLKNSENAEGWRLLGIAHAENDDDQQAIASMMHAQEVDPTNLEVLLALGVSHTNELEQAAALKYLYKWLHYHPKYAALTDPHKDDSTLYYPDVIRLFNEAARLSPVDADVHIVLGVLYNLSREYDNAITSFTLALKLKPHDYSLWNKLGATQANSIQSADAILAYQKALDLKPNYVRAWANMGISYANQGLYEESLRYYVRALMMNPKAENAWQYLRISMGCASREDMFGACDSRNIDLLQREFPL